MPYYVNHRLLMRSLFLRFLTYDSRPHCLNRQHREQYFAKCQTVIEKWRAEGPKPLNTGWDTKGLPLCHPSEYSSGIFLFLDRQNITHFFQPNFLPPYDSPEKRKIILEFLREEWDEKCLSWKPVIASDSASTTVYESEPGVFAKDEARPSKRSRSLREDSNESNQSDSF